MVSRVTINRSVWPNSFSVTGEDVGKKLHLRSVMMQGKIICQSLTKDDRHSYGTNIPGG